MKQENRKKKTKNIIILTAAVILAGIAGAAASVPLSVINKYRKTSYEYVEIVEREDEYVMEAYPEVIIDTSGTWQEGLDLPDDTEKYEPSAESIAEPEPEPEPASVPETEAESIAEPVPEPEPASVPETETEIQPEPAAESVPVPETEVPAKGEAAKPAETAAETEAVQQPAEQTKPEESAVQKPAAPSVQPLKTDDRTAVSDSGTAGNGYGSTPIYKKDRMDADIRNILLLGTDSYDITTDRGRSDTMLILSYNTKEGTIKLLSLLRDSLVPIEGHGWNRLNTAYFFGGAGLAVNTINQLFGLDIRDYVIVDFNGVKDFINYIGGVDLPLTEEEAALYSTYTGRTIEAGSNHLDAELALMHMRNRTIGTDFGRTQRQRDTVTAIISQILKEKSVAEITEIIEYAFSLVKTNIPVSTMLSLAASVIGQASSLTFETANIPYSDSYRFAWYNKMAIISFDIGETAEKLKTFLYD